MSFLSLPLCWARKPKNPYQFFFENPVPLCSFAEKDLLRVLGFMGLERARVSALVQYFLEMLGRCGELCDLDALASGGLLSEKELVVLSRFTFCQNLVYKELNAGAFVADALADDSGKAYLEESLEIDLNDLAGVGLSLVFSSAQIQALEKYRARVRHFNSLYQILVIPEISVRHFLKIQPFLKALKWDLETTEYSLLFRLKASENFLVQPYFLSLFQLRVSPKVSLWVSGVKREEDEAFYPFGPISNVPYNLYRQYSLGIYARDLSNALRALVVGDFRLELSQELVLGNPYGYFLSDFLLEKSFYQRNRAIVPSRNPLKTGALRGAALAMSLGKFQFLPFVFVNRYELSASRFQNASVNASYGRLVRDPALLSGQKDASRALQEYGFGAQMALDFGDLFVAANLLHLYLSHALNPLAQNSPYAFRSDKLLLYSLAFAWNLGELLKLSAECGVSSFLRSGSRVSDGACVLGALWNFADSWVYSFVLRYSGKQFYAPHASAFWEDLPRVVQFMQGIAFSGNTMNLKLLLDCYRDLVGKQHHAHVNARVLYALLPNFHVDGRFSWKSSVPADAYRLRGRVDFVCAFLEELVLEMLLERVFVKTRDAGNALGSRARLKVEYFFAARMSVAVSLAGYDVEAVEAKMLFLRVPLTQWFVGSKSYQDRGLEYTVAFEMGLGTVDVGVFVALDARKSLPQHKYLSQALFQLKCLW